jgi:hypothetical protein
VLIEFALPRTAAEPFLLQEVAATNEDVHDRPRLNGVGLLTPSAPLVMLSERHDCAELAIIGLKKWPSKFWLPFD